MLAETEIVSQNQEVGYYETWWGGKTPGHTTDDISALSWSCANPELDLSMDELQDEYEATGTLTFSFGNKKTDTSVTTSGFEASPSFWDRLQYALFMKADRADS